MHKAIIFLLPEFETNKSQCSKLQVDNCLSLFFAAIVLSLVCYCTTRFPYHMMFLSSKSNTTGATSGPGNGYSSGSPVFNQVFFVMFVFLDIYFSVFCVLFCHCLFLSFYLWPLCCLSFIDLRLLILLPLWYLQHFLISYI